MTIATDPHIARLIQLAKEEDLGAGDRTTSLMADERQSASFSLVAKQSGVLAGREVAHAILTSYDPSIAIDWTTAAVDGARFDGVLTKLATISGPLGPILSAERVLLNFLQRLCGIATLTRSFVDAVAGTSAGIYDTRKTTPGWRALEKYAVRCGGGQNHRMGLYDGILIKDNHIGGAGADRVAAVVFDLLNRNAQSLPVEVEVDTIEQFESLLGVVGIDVVLLDNFNRDELRAAVALRNGRGLEGKVSLEASGGITLDTVRGVAETGVDRISVGALTHSATAIDLSLDGSQC